MSMAETHQKAVLPVVSGDPVPAPLPLVRAQLDHALGDGGSGVDVAVPAGADEGIDVRGQGLQLLDASPTRGGIRRPASRGHQQETGGQKCGEEIHIRSSIGLSFISVPFSGFVPKLCPADEVQ